MFVPLIKEKGKPVLSSSSPANPVLLVKDKDSDSTSEHKAVNKPVVASATSSSSSESTSQGISTETQRDVRMDDHASKMRSKDSQTSLQGKGSLFVLTPLRTVSTFITAHTFCASRDTRVSYGWYLLIQGYFCAL